MLPIAILTMEGFQIRDILFTKPQGKEQVQILIERVHLNIPLRTVERPLSKF